MVLITLVFLLTVLILLYNWLKNLNSDHWEKRNIAYVKKSTPLGVLGEVIIKNRSLPEVYKEIYDKYKNESNVGLFIGTQPALLLRDPENVYAILAGDFQSFYSRGIAVNPDDLLADNVLFMSDYRRWKLIRQKLSPVFTSAKLRNMFYIMERCARDFADFVGEERNAKENHFDLLYNYSTSSIGAAIFGIDTNTKNTMDSPFLDMSKRAVQPTWKGSLSLFLGNSFPYLQRLSGLKTFDDNEKFFVGVVKEVMRSREREKQTRHDFIDICLELQKNGTMKDPQTGYEMEPTDEILAAQAFFFFIAGADTSANTMNFALMELANNPDILKRAHAEIDEVFKQCEDKLTYDDIGKLPYLEMVIEEAMRKFPPIGLIQRKCTKDTVLPAGNVAIKKDTLVIAPVFALHRDEKYFPNPDVFDPERFSPENAKNITKGTYLAFGDGNRICLGARFARLQVIAGLAWLLRRYSLLPQNETPCHFERNFFSLRAPDATFTLIPREKLNKRS